MNYLREEIIDYLILNQSYYKYELASIKAEKQKFLSQEPKLFHIDIEEQYEARVKQKIAFHAAEALGLPVENIILELERIELDEFLAI
jgi:hypothetical protein